MPDNLEQLQGKLLWVTFTAFKATALALAFLACQQGNVALDAVYARFRCLCTVSAMREQGIGCMAVAGMHGASDTRLHYTSS